MHRGGNSLHIQHLWVWPSLGHKGDRTPSSSLLVQSEQEQTFWGCFKPGHSSEATWQPLHGAQKASALSDSQPVAHESLLRFNRGEKKCCLQAQKQKYKGKSEVNNHFPAKCIQQTERKNKICSWLEYK